MLPNPNPPRQTESKSLVIVVAAVSAVVILTVAWFALGNRPSETSSPTTAPRSTATPAGPIAPGTTTRIVVTPDTLAWQAVVGPQDLFTVMVPVRPQIVGTLEPGGSVLYTTLSTPFVYTVSVSESASARPYTDPEATMAARLADQAKAGKGAILTNEATVAQGFPAHRFKLSVKDPAIPDDFFEGIVVVAGPYLFTVSYGYRTSGDPKDLDRFLTSFVISLPHG